MWIFPFPAPKRSPKRRKFEDEVAKKVAEKMMEAFRSLNVVAKKARGW